MIELKQASLVDILPSSLLDDPNVVAAAKAIDTELCKLTDQISQLPIYSRMDKLSSEECDDQAWELNIDFYDHTLPLVKRRELVKNALIWHQQKGTPSAVEGVISTLFDEAEVKEWFDYNGKPYHFKVITREILNAEKYDLVVQAINLVKRASSVLDDVEVNRDYKNVIEIGSDMERLSYPYLSFTSEYTYCGTHPDGPRVVHIPDPPIYSSDLGVSNSYSAVLQDPYVVCGTMYTGGYPMPPQIKYDDQLISYESSLGTSNTYSNLLHAYKLCGTSITGEDEL